MPKFNYLNFLPEYRIYENGKIFSEKSNKFLSYYKNEAGYYLARLVNSEGQKKLYRIHVLVAMAWVKNKNPNKLKLVNHIDGNKLNIHKDNLEWSNYKHNNNHACKSKLNTRRRKCSVKTSDGNVHNFNSIKEALKFFKCRSLGSLENKDGIFAVSVENMKTTFNDKIIIRDIAKGKDILVDSLSAASSFTKLNRTGIKKRLARRSMVPLKGYQFKLLGDTRKWRTYTDDELALINTNSGASTSLSVICPKGNTVNFSSIRKFFISIEVPYNDYHVRKFKNTKELKGYRLKSLSK